MVQGYAIRQSIERSWIEIQLVCYPVPLVKVIRLVFIHSFIRSILSISYVEQAIFLDLVVVFFILKIMVKNHLEMQQILEDIKMCKLHLTIISRFIYNI